MFLNKLTKFKKYMFEINSTEKFKIAYIIPRFYPFKGGAEENFYQLAKRIANEKHNVVVLTSKIKFRNENLKKEELIENIYIKRFWQPNESLYLGFYPELFFHLIKNKYDIIHASGIGFAWREFCLIIYKIFKGKKTLLVNTPHGPFMATNKESSKIRKLIKTIGTYFLKIYINYLYDLFIAVNPKQHEWMIKEYKIKENKIHLVPNSIEKSYIEKPSNLVLHSKEKPVVISFIGRLEWYKGVQNVIKALSRIKQLNWKFIIMGRSGNYTQNILDLIKKYFLEEKIKVIFSPTDEERDDILKNQSQITILPSLWEATGISLIEGMAKGNAIITTKQNEGSDMLIIEGKSGYTYDFYDIEKLSKILELLIKNYDLLQKIRKHNIKFAKNFTWESIFSKYLKLLTQKYKEKVNG